MDKEAYKEFIKEDMFIRWFLFKHKECEVSLIDNIKRMYLQEGKSLRDIASRLGVSHECVRKKMIKHGIQRRERVEAVRNSGDKVSSSRFTQKWFGVKNQRTLLNLYRLSYRELNWLYTTNSRKRNRLQNRDYLYRSWQDEKVIKKFLDK